MSLPGPHLWPPVGSELLLAPSEEGWDVVGGSVQNVVRPLWLVPIQRLVVLEREPRSPEGVAVGLRVELESTVDAPDACVPSRGSSSSRGREAPARGPQESHHQ